MITYGICLHWFQNPDNNFLGKSVDYGAFKVKLKISLLLT
jgi:hypothetical protein